MVEYVINPPITPAQLFAFYERNNICEVGYGEDVATIPLTRSSVIVGAFDRGELIGVAPAMFDGLDAHIYELSVDVRYQGAVPRAGNGSVIASDDKGVGRGLGQRLFDYLFGCGCQAIIADVVEGVEEAFYEGLGMIPNNGMVPYILDRRPYMLRSDET